MKKLLRKKLSRICNLRHFDKLFHQNDWCFCIHKNLSSQVSSTSVSTFKVDWTNINKIYEKDSSGFSKKLLQLSVKIALFMAFVVRFFSPDFALLNVLTNKQQAIQKSTDLQPILKLAKYPQNYSTTAIASDLFLINVSLLT